MIVNVEIKQPYCFSVALLQENKDRGPGTPNIVGHANQKKSIKKGQYDRKLNKINESKDERRGEECMNKTDEAELRDALLSKHFLALQRNP